MCMIQHELKRNYKSFLIWALVTGGCILVFMLIYPEFGGMPESISSMYAQMGAFSDAFGLDRIGIETAVGFYGVEGGTMLALGGSMFAAMLGCGMLAKEEGGHTAEFLYGAAGHRSRVIGAKLAVVFILITLFSLFCLGCGLLSFVCIGETVEWGKILLLHGAQWLMCMEIGTACFGISGFLRKNNVGVGIGIAIILYFINIFINISDKLDILKYVTPFYYGDASRVLTDNAISAGAVAGGWSIGLILCCVGIFHYMRKDLAA